MIFQCGQIRLQKFSEQIRAELSDALCGLHHTCGAREEKDVSEFYFIASFLKMIALRAIFSRL